MPVIVALMSDRSDKRQGLLDLFRASSTREQEDELTDASAQAARDTATRLLQTVQQVARELHPDQHFPVELTLDSSLDVDFAFDSLGRVELQLRLERIFDVSLPESLLSHADTPRDLLRTVQGAKSRTNTTSVPDVETVNVVLDAATSYPHSAKTLIDVLEWHLNAHPDRPHIRLYDPEGEGEVISFRQLKEGALKIAAGLQMLDLQCHEPVVLMLPTGADYFFSFFGVLYAGGIPCPIYPPGRLSQIEEHLHRHVGIVNNAGAGIMLTLDEALPFADLMRDRVASLRHVVTPDSVQARGSTELHLPALHAQDIAFLQYTSGSTGMPKGVVLTHANLLANIRAMGEVVEASSKDVFVSWLPLYHDMGLIGAWFGSLYYAAQLVIMSPLTFIVRPQRWLEAIHRFGGTLSASPNFGYEHCLRLLDDKSLGELDLSSWRCAFNGAEAVSPHTLKAFCTRFSRFGFNASAMMPVYGLAENTVGLAFPPLRRGVQVDRIDRERFMHTGVAEPCDPQSGSALEVVACGRPLPHHQFRVVDDRDRELRDRQEGRIQFKGPSSTTGYFHNPEQTRALFHDEWLETNDLGYVCKGELYVTGRLKDLVILAGRNVHPAELEAEIGELDDIRKGCVVVFGSRSREQGTERLVVVAETRKRDEATRQDLRRSINQLATDLLGLPADEVMLVEPHTVLKTSSGKVRRSDCRVLFESGSIGEKRAAPWQQFLRLRLGGVVSMLRRLRRRTLDYAFAAYGWGLYSLLVLLALPPFVLLPDLRLRWAVIQCAARLLGMLTGTIVRVEGRENLPHENTACIFVSNHASYLDGYAYVGFLPRCVRFVAKGELRAKKVIAFLLRRMAAEFVERFDPGKGIADAERITDKARESVPLFYFAEGTFTRVPGLRPFQMGAFITASAQRLPVVPMAIRGTRTILRPESWFPRRGTIIISIGKPIPPQT